MNRNKPVIRLAWWSLAIAVVTVAVTSLLVEIGGYSFWPSKFFLPPVFIAVYFSSNPHNWSGIIFYSVLAVQIFLMVFLIAIGIWIVLSKLKASGKA